MTEPTTDRPAPGIRRLLAPNPSAMTGPGTNGYIVGEGVVAVVDPGPEDERHLAAWLEALSDETVSHVLFTHAHRDHTGLARRLADAVRAPVAGFGRWEEGRSATMARLAGEEGILGGEGGDRSLDPDLRLADGDVVAGPGWSLGVLHIPGHAAGHLAFAFGNMVLTGDHVLPWTSTLISPPDGDLRQFLASCARLRGLGAQAFVPGHGDPVTEPTRRLDWLVAHRREREEQIEATLAGGPAEIGEIVQRLYADTPRAVWPAAARSVLSHLIALVEEGRVEADPTLSATARYRLADAAITSGRGPEPLL